MDTRASVGVRVALVFGTSLVCAACTTMATPPSETVAEPAPSTLASEQFVSTNEPAVLARKHFERGDYGLAETYFRQTVERNPRDVDSWIGLAASYDNLKRFELADRAYERALKLSGPTVPLLNNLGYSYLLRGDTRKAKSSFERALALDPTNVTILNNIRILSGGKPLPPAPK